MPKCAISVYYFQDRKTLVPLRLLMQVIEFQTVSIDGSGTKKKYISDRVNID
jgi:hypothetical protein